MTLADLLKHESPLVRDNAINISRYYQKLAVKRMAPKDKINALIARGLHPIMLCTLTNVQVDQMYQKEVHGGE